MVKRHFFGLFGRCWLLMALLPGLALAQAPLSFPVEAFSYTMVQGDGTNASAVAWDEAHSAFVTVIAGNPEFPLEVFDDQGNPISQVMAGEDMRGLWYNPNLGKLECNGPGENGWFTFELDADRVPTPAMELLPAQYQPNYNAVAAYDALKRQVIFLDFSADGLALISRKNPKKIKKISFDFASSDLGNINSTSVGYTGHTNYEFVVLDVAAGKLVFFNRSGNETGSAQLPEDAPLYDTFAFSFAHDHAFLYDKEARVWHSYKVW